jgi:hypothetical protein
MSAQLALSIFDVLPEGFVPKVRERVRRVMRSSGAIPVQEQQLSFMDLLTMREEDIPPVTWSEDDVDTLREGILREACHVLLDKRAGVATRRDRWLWINDDKWTPFSFRTCAATAGVDYEELRASLVSLMRYHKVLHQLQAA